MIFDVLIPQAMRHRPTAFLNALCSGAQVASVDAQPMVRYHPRPGSVLVTYGLGGRDRLPHAQEHQRRGGRFVAFDAGYWERKTLDRKFRLSIDGFHCPALIMRGPDPSGDRLASSGLMITDAHHPKGDIVLVGNGPKSQAIGAAGWAAAKSRELRNRWPQRRVVYRPKRAVIERDIVSVGVDAVNPIETVLQKASLVVCLHSNVAVDACRMGIPVVCEDGAASAIYPSRLEDEAAQPDAETRMRFLRRLAWWQWSRSEVQRGEIWPWLLEQLA